MNYVFCPKCNRVRPGAVTRFDHVICSECGTNMRRNSLNFETCPVCSNKLYFPKDQVEHIVFPCHPQGNSTLPEDYQTEIPGEVNITEDMTDPGKPIQIKWDPMPDDLLYIHQRSRSIPPYSVLIVREDQEAIYYASGSSVRLAGGNTYPLFDDPRTEEEIVAGIYQGLSAEDSLAYRLDTRIIFVDKRNHDLMVQMNSTLPGDIWKVTLPCDIAFQISEPENLLQNAGAIRDTKQTTEEIKQTVINAVEREIAVSLNRLSEDQIAEIKTKEELKQVLTAFFAEEAIKISQRANQRLVGRRGVRIAYLDLDCMNALCWNRATAYQAECPECGELNWVEKENRKAFICTACKEKATWCGICGRFTKSMATKDSGDVCTECKYPKFK